jgi:hypothetical protein
MPLFYRRPTDHLAALRQLLQGNWVYCARTRGLDEEKVALFPNIAA